MEILQMDATDHGARRQITFNPGGMRSNAGFLLLEVLISLVLVSIGLLGLVKLGAVAHGAALESYQTTQGTFLLYDIVERINAHRDSAGCFAFTSNTEN